MSYGHLSEKQAAIVRRHVTGKEVHDLGAGFLELAHELLKLGATKIIAIEKEFLPVCEDARIERLKMYFADYDALGSGGPIDIAFISWPANRHDQGLLDLVSRAETVIYLGKNSDGSSCGHPRLFYALLHRELLDYLPERKNTLIVYGKKRNEPRPPRGEERAGRIQLDGGAILSYETVEEKV